MVLNPKKRILKNRTLRLIIIFVIVLLYSFAIWDYRDQDRSLESTIAITSATPQMKIEKQPESREGMFYRIMENRTAQCQICFRNCIIPQGQRGFCKNKENKDGVLYNIVYAKPSAVHIDSVEKEPQHHMLPGTQALCIGTAGCNFACRHCQNWHLSQHGIDQMRYQVLLPQDIVTIALKKNIPTISFTYNDPIAMYEYLYDTARLAKQNGLYVLWHSNGSLNPDPLRKLLKYTDAVTIDLKAFQEEIYEQIFSGKLDPVLKTLKIIKEQGVWLEIVNLLIPNINDDPEDIRKMSQWIKKNLGENVPLHFSRFFPSYRLTNLPPTPISTLEEAYRIARESGLRYVSIGNVPGHEKNSTFCPQCDSRVIKRIHFQVIDNHILNGKCRFCGHLIPGIWNPDLDTTHH